MTAAYFAAALLTSCSGLNAAEISQPSTATVLDIPEQQLELNGTDIEGDLILSAKNTTLIVHPGVQRVNGNLSIAGEGNRQKTQVYQCSTPQARSQSQETWLEGVDALCNAGHTRNTSRVASQTGCPQVYRKEPR